MLQKQVKMKWPFLGSGTLKVPAVNSGDVGIVETLTEVVGFSPASVVATFGADCDVRICYRKPE